MSTALTPGQALPPSIPGAAASAAAADTYTSPGGLAALKNAPPSPATLHAVAEQVEALFLQMMLKSMRDASEAAGVSESNERGMYEDMFDKQVALTLSHRNDLGFVRLLERQLGGAPPASAPSLRGPATAPTADSAAGGVARSVAARYGAGVPSMSPALGDAPASGTGASPAGEAASAAPQAGGAPSRASGDASPASHAAARAFVQEILPPIRQAARMLGVNPLGLLAQAALESGWGQRMPRNADGSPSLNLFGVKAGEEWGGARVVADTVEFSGGVAQLKRSAFRAYGSIEESVSDFARLLAGSPRYRDVLRSGASAAGYVAGIAQAGYASDPSYGNKLNQILNGTLLRSALGRRTAL
ncbi:MAG TPA: flagellar assembly peptidoglycan hydrolase FlgJ [Steroidobacteraceae bacterium]|nr:flagellar assembly peptidoglycan hydrolase FlgJ [Steroidobacteraceae bacterium]